MVCLHGFTDTWRSWELVLPALERCHDVLALTLAGHAGGPAILGDPSPEALADAVERAMDEAGFGSAHVVGNSLGGYLALKLAERDRARTVVALAPAGGWALDDDSYKQLLRSQAAAQRQVQALSPYARQILATRQGRRRATRGLLTHCDHVPVELLVHLMRGMAACSEAERLIEYALEQPWTLQAEKIRCPVRILWGTADTLLPWPSAAARYREDWLPHADWIELEGVGHCPQLDVPMETAQMILGFTALTADRRGPAGPA